MREIQAIYKGQMVCAIKNLVKTETRRMDGLEDINKDPNKWYYQRYGGMAIGPHVEYKHQFWDETGRGFFDPGVICPYGKRGDILWVRETYRELVPTFGIADKYVYRADGVQLAKGEKWTPSIHMPRVACRLFLEVLDVRAERLIKIGEDSAQAEGVQQLTMGWLSSWVDYTGQKDRTMLASASFLTLWESIYGKESVDLNPWVWVIKFKLLTDYKGLVKEDQREWLTN